MKNFLRRVALRIERSGDALIKYFYGICQAASAALIVSAVIIPDISMVAIVDGFACAIIGAVVIIWYGK